MGVTKIVLVTLVCCGVIVARDFRKPYKTKMYYQDDGPSLCAQQEGDCEACLEKSQNCYWCDNGAADGECKSAQGCPNPDQRSRSCGNEPQKYDYDTQSREYNYENRPRETYESQPGKHYYYESEKASNDQVEKELESLLLAQEDVPVQTENASLFCAVSGNCSSCVAQDVCFWCQTKQRCYSYFNDSLISQVCPDNKGQWYRNQCRYKGKRMKHLFLDLKDTKVKSCPRGEILIVYTEFLAQILKQIVLLPSFESREAKVFSNSFDFAKCTYKDCKSSCCSV